MGAWKSLSGVGLLIVVLYIWIEIVKGNAVVTLGIFAQKIDRDCSRKQSGTIRARSILRVDSPFIV